MKRPPEMSPTWTPAKEFTVPAGKRRRGNQFRRESGQKRQERLTVSADSAGLGVGEALLSDTGEDVDERPRVGDGALVERRRNPLVTVLVLREGRCTMETLGRRLHKNWTMTEGTNGAEGAVRVGAVREPLLEVVRSQETLRVLG